MNVDRVYVVTVTQPGKVLTRCQFACGTAHDFLAWVRSKGWVGSMRTGMEVVRGSEEHERAVRLARQFVEETGLFQGPARD